MTTPAIHVRGLTKRYGATTALDGLDLDVPRGTIFGFLGPNGAGKTTAMRTLVGLTRPTSGTVQVLGYDALMQGLEVRRRVGYLAQLPRFHDDLTPRSTLWFARRFFPLPDRDAARVEVEEALDLVGLRVKADSPVGSLSGGQRQRLGIAQATVHRPQLLILDEPASALDPVGRRDVLEILRTLRGATTVFFSTHILDDVERVSDEVAIVDGGRRVTQAPIDTLLAGDGHPTVAVTMRGDVEAALRRLRSHSWVAEAGWEPSPPPPVATSTSSPGDAPVVVHVATRDLAEAEHQLLRVVLEDPDVSVLEVRTHRIELEEAFLRHLTPAATEGPRP